MDRIPSDQAKKKNKIPQVDYSRQQANKMDSSSKNLERRGMLSKYKEVYKSRLIEKNMSQKEIGHAGNILETRIKTGTWEYGGRDKEYLIKEVREDYGNFKKSERGNL